MSRSVHGIRLLVLACVALLMLAAAPTDAGAQQADPVVPPMHAMVDALKPGAAPGLLLAIQFEPNSARVRPASGPLLGNLVAALLAPELQASRFVIEGHGDASAGAPADPRLPQQRAEEVRLYLVALGVPAARLRAVGPSAGVQAEPNRIRVVAQP